MFPSPSHSLHHRTALKRHLLSQNNLYIGPEPYLLSQRTQHVALKRYLWYQGILYVALGPYFLSQLILHVALERYVLYQRILSLNTNRASCHTASNPFCYRQPHYPSCLTPATVFAYTLYCQAPSDDTIIKS